MELIIDANVLISALVTTRGFTYDLIFRDDIKLFSPEYILEEFQEHKKEIIGKSCLSEEDLQLFLSLISVRINLIEKQKFEEFIEKAKEITPDQDDTEYFALALKLNCSIWSNDKKLKQQNNIRVYSTDDLIKIIQRD